MAQSANNLRAVLQDTADAIKAQTGSDEPISPRNFADQISSIQSGGTGGGSLYLHVLSNFNQNEFSIGVTSNCWTIDNNGAITFDNSAKTYISRIAFLSKDANATSPADYDTFINKVLCFVDSAPNDTDNRNGSWTLQKSGTDINLCVKGYVAFYTNSVKIYNMSTASGGMVKINSWTDTVTEL